MLVLASEPNEVAKVEKFLIGVNAVTHLDDERFHKLLIATTEAVNNSIIHGNQKDPKKKVTLTCVVTNANLIVRVHDEGIGFDPSTIPDPRDKENLLREYGRGVFLIRSLMDSVEFEKTDKGADVIMTMKL